MHKRNVKIFKYLFGSSTTFNQFVLIKKQIILLQFFPFAFLFFSETKRFETDFLICCPALTFEIVAVFAFNCIGIAFQEIQKPKCAVSAFSSVFNFCYTSFLFWLSCIRLMMFFGRTFYLFCHYWGQVGRRNGELGVVI